MLISATAAPKCSKAVKHHTYQIISVLLLQLSLKFSPFWLTAASLNIIIVIQLFSPLYFQLTNSLMLFSSPGRITTRQEITTQAGSLSFFVVGCFSVKCIFLDAQHQWYNKTGFWFRDVLEVILYCYHDHKMKLCCFCGQVRLNVTDTLDYMVWGDTRLNGNKTKHQKPCYQLRALSIILIVPLWQS